MGLLTIGTPLSWHELESLRGRIKKHGIEQFINRYRLIRDVKGTDQHWGDEMECILIVFDHQKKEVKALLKSDDLLQRIATTPSLVSQNWQPEYAAFMIEGVPTTPYNCIKDCVSVVENNFKKRRNEIQNLLEENETILTIGNFPRTGCPDFCVPAQSPNALASLSRSIFYPDSAIYLKHPHFPTVTRNITDRRGSKPHINLPIYRDTNTPDPFLDDFDGRKASEFDLMARKPDHVYLDSLPFGPSCCCLQMTFQTKTETDARWLRDQFIPISPILLALSAATPIFRGFLTDVDCRWDVMKFCLDDRTEAERNPKSDEFLPTCRCESVDMYISEENSSNNDLHIPHCNEAYEMLTKAGIDSLLAESISHLFVRDPVQVFREKLGQDDTETTELFEDIHLFHWRTVRLKLPPKDGSSGWKVEFRPTEIQMSDFQNAAFAVFLFLLSRVILERKIDFVMPISEVFENMQIAQRRDAVLNEKFWFRTLVTPDGRQSGLTQLSADQIINGDQSLGVVGVASLIDDWLSQCDQSTDAEKASVRRYVDFVRRRASGDQPTVARWIRDFVKSHGDYRHDSVVSNRVTYDLLDKMKAFANFDSHYC